VLGLARVAVALAALVLAGIAAFGTHSSRASTLVELGPPTTPSAEAEGAAPAAESAKTTVGEIEILSKHELQQRVLSASALRLSPCERREIAAGATDRRLLATLEVLLASGLAPTVAMPDCAAARTAPSAGSQTTNEHALTISALNGIPIRGHDGPGSLAEQAAHLLLALPPALKPQWIVLPPELQTGSATATSSGSAGAIEVAFAPPGPASGRPASARPGPRPGPASAGAPGTATPPSDFAQAPSAINGGAQRAIAQGRRLLTRISRLSEPSVSDVTGAAAAGGDAGSPAPGTEPLAQSLPLPLGAAPGVTADGIDVRSSALAPLAQPQCPHEEPDEPQVLLETPGTGSVLTKQTEDPELAVRTTGISSITSYEFQYRAAEASCSEQWTTIEKTAGPDAIFETNVESAPVKDGLYNLRVVVSTAGGGTYEAQLRDRLIANNSPVVTLSTRPPSDGRGTIVLSASAPSSAKLASLTLQWAPAGGPPGSSRWRTIGGPVPGGDLVTQSFDTTTLPEGGNGEYDFRVIPANQGEFVSIPVRGLLVDNQPPTVQLTQPAPESHLSSQAQLAARATDSGSGVAYVRFQERSLAGTGAWAAVGGRTTLPETPGSDVYASSLQTDALPNGPYELRAIATDRAGNEATSAAVAVTLENASPVPTVAGSIAGVLAPARIDGFLGAIKESAEHETWAYGFTSAPPADVNGSPLPYEAPGEQLVLLRYTDRGGWQIADVPRGPAGEPFKLLKASEVTSVTGGGYTPEQVHVTGAMTPSGEAWLALSEASTNKGQPPIVGLFHRSPGGQFRLDAQATQALGPLLGAEATDPGSQAVGLRLGESEGEVFGMLAASGQYAPLDELQYGLLQGGAWKLETVKAASLPPAPFRAEDPVKLRFQDVERPGEGWGAFEVKGHPPGLGLVLGHLRAGEWTFAPTGLDALDLSGAVGAETGGKGEVIPEALKADGAGVWIEAKVGLGAGRESGRVVARYEGEGAGGHVTDSWCALPVSNSCQEPLETTSGRAAVPDAIFDEGATGPTALALHEGSLDVYTHGKWTSILAPGYGPSAGQTGADDAFASAGEGWLGGAPTLGHFSSGAGSPTGGASRPLTSWPLPDRAPLLGVALPPGSEGELGEAGALAVGLIGTTLRYEPSAGWLAAPVPPRARKLNLYGVAFAGPSSAYAVGQFGVILHWDGSAWSEGPQSISLTQSQLNAVSFGASGEGWAVGANGTILHYDGSGWSKEEPPQADSGVNITSVAVAGSEVFAVAGGNLITRSPQEGWQEVEPSQLPNGLASGELRVVAGLPDGGVVAAGKSLALVREREGQSFQYPPQPLEGIAVALAPYREGDGQLRAYVSVAPPAAEHELPPEIGGVPPGDGELLRETASGWQDLSQNQYAGNEANGDGAVKSDPVLAVASGQSGEHAWAVGGYDGTEDAIGRGTAESLSSRPVGWQSASIWRYDSVAGGQPPDLQSIAPSLPAEPGTVSFAFFTSPMCKEECAAVADAQPDVNLSAAARQIAAFAAEPGGPAFAMFGGNAVGPLEGSKVPAAKEEADFAHLPELLAPLGGLPTFAALGPFDYVAGTSNRTLPWAETFAGAPPPQGTGPPAAAITPLSSPTETPTSGETHLYYAFDATENEGRLRVLVLDNANAKGTLEDASQQRPWLERQLASAQSEGIATVVIAARPLRNLNRGNEGEVEELASLLARSGVLAVFTTDGSLAGNTASEVHELDEHHLIPENAEPGQPQIPEYEGATLGYQQTKNDGVTWYLASVDTAPEARAVRVAAVPVTESLALKAVDGLSVARSHTLQFEAVGRRPAGTLATRVGESFQGYDDYVEIPAPGCGATCVQPSYSFTSSEPTVGDFVQPSGEGSPLPKLSSGGHPIPSSTSGLFCAYNAGTTTVTVTAGLLSYSEAVTVQRGSFGQPCGTVPPAAGGAVVIHSTESQKPAGTAAPPPPPAPISAVTPALTFIPPPPPVSAPGAPHPAAKTSLTAPPAPTVPEAQVAPIEPLGVPAAILPVPTPPVEPIPPGGAYAQSPSAAERREKARKHASQSAFAIRPAGATVREGHGGEQWFYAALGIATLLALALTARALPTGPRDRPVLVEERRIRSGSESQRARRLRGGA